MNLILLFENDFLGPEKVRLKDRRYQYVVEIHRALEGDVLCVGFLNGKMGRGVISLINEKYLEMDVIFDCKPPAPHPAELFLALPRPIVLKRVLIAIASMGVKKIILFNAKRVEKSFWSSPALKKEKLHEQLILGLEQSKDTVLPEILLRPLFKPFVEDEMPHLLKNRASFAAHPEAQASCPMNVKKPMVLMVGPEGGFIPYEIEKLLSRGFSLVSLGERILRVETAVPVFLSRVL